MNDHHLDDLIIGDPEPASGKSKGLLTIIALLIVILIVGLILWALIFGSSDDAATQPETPAQSTSTHSLDPSLIPLDASGQEQKRPTPSAPVTKTKPTPTTVKTPKKPAPKPASKPTVTPPAPITKPAPPKTTKPATTPAKTQAAPKEQTSTPAPKEGTVLIKNANKTIYYIQVGAFKRDPSPKFMKKLKENGFTFITKKTNNMRRVRVGPYDSYDEAKAALPDIKAKLGIDGLIVKF